MIYRIILSPDAKADISSAVRWYQRTDPDLAFRFTLETRAIQRRIKHLPYSFPIIRGIVRRALLREFPYSVFFSVNYDAVFVIAILHQRRADILWMDQANGRN